MERKKERTNETDSNGIKDRRLLVSLSLLLVSDQDSIGVFVEGSEGE